MNDSDSDDLAISELNENYAADDTENGQDLQEEIDNAIDNSSSQGDEEQREKLMKLPLGRIKAIIKMDPEVNMINQEAVFMITKSAVNYDR
jgi:DNA polymerase epsilon subunit 4